MSLLILLGSPEDYMLPCLSKQILGIECFGCGGQRSVSLLFHGEFIAAFKMYPAIYPLVLLSFFIVANLFFKFKHSSKIINTLAIVTITTIVVSYLIKIIN
ncbi:MAG: DUF2752 domain-containing protein [Chlorobi bacterium]|nr:DUF2752 domain-containing protein [Chlorobiota bacterium]